LYLKIKGEVAEDIPKNLRRYPLSNR